MSPLESDRSEIVESHEDPRGSFFDTPEFKIGHNNGRRIAVGLALDYFEQIKAQTSKIEGILGRLPEGSVDEANIEQFTEATARIKLIIEGFRTRVRRNKFKDSSLENQPPTT